MLDPGSLDTQLSLCKKELASDPSIKCKGGAVEFIISYINLRCMMNCTINSSPYLCEII